MSLAHKAFLFLRITFILHVSQPVVHSSHCTVKCRWSNNIAITGPLQRACKTLLPHLSFIPCKCSVFSDRLKRLGCENLDDLSHFDSQLQLSLAAWGYYSEDYIRLSTGIRILQTTRGTRSQDYEIQLVHSLAERRLNEKWSLGEYQNIFFLIWEELYHFICPHFYNGHAGQFVHLICWLFEFNFYLFYDHLTILNLSFQLELSYLAVLWHCAFW